MTRLCAFPLADVECAAAGSCGSAPERLQMASPLAASFRFLAAFREGSLRRAASSGNHGAVAGFCCHGLGMSWSRDVMASGRGKSAGERARPPDIVKPQKKRTGSICSRLVPGCGDRAAPPCLARTTAASMSRNAAVGGWWCQVSGGRGFALCRKRNGGDCVFAVTPGTDFEKTDEVSVEALLDL